MGASSQITSCEFYINWCEISIMSIGHTQMSNGPLDEKKCPLDFQMSIRPLDEQKCPVMSSGHSNVHWTYCRGIEHVCALDVLFVWRQAQYNLIKSSSVASVDNWRGGYSYTMFCIINFF